MTGNPLLRSDGIAEIRAVAGRISDVDDHVTVHQAADEIERLRAELVEERHTVLELQREFMGPLPSGNKTRLEQEVERLRAGQAEAHPAAAPAAEHPSPSRSEVLEVAAKIADEFADMFRTEPPPYSDNFWAGANIAKAIRALKDARPDDRSAT